jgi:hypothetical protein
MKLAYKTWNPEHYVNDKIILQELYEMSDRKLTFPDGYSIDMLLDKEKQGNGTYINQVVKKRPAKRKPPKRQ